DPAADERDFALAQPAAGFGLRHPFRFVLRRDAAEQLALLRLAWHDHRAIFPLGKCSLFSVEPEVRLSLGLVRPVAIEAVVGEDRPDIAVELDGLRQGLGSTGKRDPG